MVPSLWTSIYVELSPEDALKRIAQIGFPAVELSTEHLCVLRDAPGAETRLVAFRSLAEDLGLQMDQAHITISVDVASMDEPRRRADQEIVLQDIGVLSKLGIHSGVLHPGGGATLDDWATVEAHNTVRVEAISRLADAARDAGIRLALENGVHTFGPHRLPAWVGSTAGVRELIEQIGSPALGICVDTGHAILEHWDVPEALRHAGDLLIATHIADNDGSGDQHRIPYSYGSKVDWTKVVAALKQIGYTGPFNLEIPGERGRPYEIIDATLRKALEMCTILLADQIGPQPEAFTG